MGGCRCTYRDCPVKSERNNNIHLFHYPVFNKSRCMLWLKNARRMDMLKLTVAQLKNRVICQHHFKPEMFRSLAKNSLKFDAVPTENGPYCTSDGFDESTTEEYTGTSNDYMPVLKLVDKRVHYKETYCDFVSKPEIHLDVKEQIPNDNVLKNYVAPVKDDISNNLMDYLRMHSNKILYNIDEGLLDNNSVLDKLMTNPDPIHRNLNTAYNPINEIKQTDLTLSKTEGINVFKQPYADMPQQSIVKNNSLLDNVVSKSKDIVNLNTDQVKLYKVLESPIRTKGILLNENIENKDINIVSVENISNMSRFDKLEHEQNKTTVNKPVKVKILEQRCIKPKHEVSGTGTQIQENFSNITIHLPKNKCDVFNITPSFVLTLPEKDTHQAHLNPHELQYTVPNVPVDVLQVAQDSVQNYTKQNVDTEMYSEINKNEKINIDSENKTEESELIKIDIQNKKEGEIIDGENKKEKEKIQVDSEKNNEKVNIYSENERIKKIVDTLTFIEEKRKLNMKNIIEETIDKLDKSASKPAKNRSLLRVKKDSNVGNISNKDIIPIQASSLESKLQIMERNLLTRIDQNTQQILDMRKLLITQSNGSISHNQRKVSTQTKWPEVSHKRRKVSTQTKWSEVNHKQYLFNEISKYLSKDLTSNLYEELFLDKFKPTLVCNSRKQAKKRRHSERVSNNEV